MSFEHLEVGDIVFHPIRQEEGIVEYIEYDDFDDPVSAVIQMSGGTWLTISVEELTVQRLH